MSSCIFCQKQDNVHDRKIYGACEVSGGRPCGPCIEYLELEGQIERTRQTLEKQLARRREIRQNINRVHDTMLFRVPPEITAYIFELAASVSDIPPDETVSESPLEGQIYDPLPLGNVCGAWRDIAWGMPHLWTFLFARIRTVEDLPLHLDIATQWLSRSGEYLPLSIHFYIDDAEDEDGEWIWEEFIPFIMLLNNYSSRWKDLCGVARFPILAALYAKHQGAPMLQNLQLSPTDVQDEMTFDLGCERLPQPRSVHFNNICAPDFHIDWAYVTRLETNTFLISLFLEMFPQLHELKELRITGLDMYPNHQTYSVTHLKLESLSIACTNRGERENLCIFLNSLILPSLQHLRIKLLQDRNTLRKTISLIQRSCCTLLSLSLSRCPRNAHDYLIHLLECANSIEELQISNTTQYDGDFLAALRDRLKARDNPESRPLALSNLQRLIYIPKVLRNVPWKLLLPIFDPKWVANQPGWKTLSISPRSTSNKSESPELVHSGLEDEVLERLLNIVEAGIELFFPREINKNEILDVMKEKADERAVSEAERAELEMMDWEE